jgi:hypothetical protein
MFEKNATARVYDVEYDTTLRKHATVSPSAKTLNPPLSPERLGIHTLMHRVTWKWKEIFFVNRAIVRTQICTHYAMQPRQKVRMINEH